MVHRTTMALLAVALVLSACGGGEANAGVASLSEDDVTATTAASGGDATSDDPEEVEAAMLAWAECMRAEGVDVQDPTVDADGNVQLFAVGGGQGGGQGGPQGGDPGDREAMQAAFEACNEHMEGVSLGFERGDQTEMQDTLLEFAACMRDNGVDMPDPDISSFGPPDEVEEGDAAEGEPGQGGPFGGVDMDDPDFQAAQEACSDILGGFGPGGGGPGGGPGNTNTQESDSDA